MNPRKPATPTAFGGAYFRQGQTWHYATFLGPDGWYHGYEDAEEVPGAITLPGGGMWAPEVKWGLMVDPVGAALALGISASTFRSYVARGQAPPAMVRLGGTPGWSLPVLYHWQASRPGHGGRPAQS